MLKLSILLSLWLSGLQAIALTTKESPSTYCTELKQAAKKGTPTQRLTQYFTTQWRALMIDRPEFATYVGYPGQNARLSDNSLARIEQRKRESVCELNVLKQIPAQNLKGEDLINFNLAKRYLELSIEGSQFGSEYLALTHLSGLHLDMADLLLAMPTVNKKDYENMLSRLELVPEQAAQVEVLLREGLKRGITPVKMFLARVPQQFERVLPSAVDESPLFKPFADMKLSDNENTDLRLRAREVLKSKVYPALQKLKEYLVTHYIPKAREGIAMSEMPNGKSWYAFKVKEETTTNQTPDELHALGLSEVARLKGEMETIKQNVKFKGDLNAFNKFLMKDPQFFYKDADSLMIGFRNISKQIDPELPRLFKTLPRLTYGIREMPAYKAKEAPAAYYEGGSLQSGRPGYFTANTSDLPGRPIWGMEALTLHEAVPGHHFQIAISQELQGLPEFRKYGSSTAFVEGWALYAEGLGDDLGLYKNPYSKYGQLSYEMWRAIRLVVDTGLHSKGWSRQQAIDFFASHMPKSQVETEVEVDRYVTWPGQALSYKVGQLKFRELRQQAQSELGAKFDIREFHDQVLGHGSLPLDVLEKAVSLWIKEQKNAKPIKPKNQV